MTFYDFLKSKADPYKASQSKVCQYALELLHITERIAFPKANKDRKTVERAFKNALKEDYDSYMFETVWDAYESEKFYDDILD